MVIDKLSLSSLEIPFRTGFKHNSAERRMTQSVLVAAESRNGAIGRGEGCPREYVTGESLASCREFFAAHRESWMRFGSVQEVALWTDRHETEIDANPAAWCAVELALLDLFSKETSCSLEKTLGLPELHGHFQYTAVLGDSPPEVFRAQLKRYVDMGFADFKVKISGDQESDGAKLGELLALAGSSARIRLDGNNLWRDPSRALAYLRALPVLPYALEEPLGAFDFGGVAEIARTLAIRIILDESVLRREHLRSIPVAAGGFIVNLRVSKMGGLFRSMKLADSARRLNLPLVVGAQVGETSLLTRSALTIANAYRDLVIAQEGAFGTLLLESDIVAKPLVFGKGGRLHPGDFLETGLSGFQMAYTGYDGGSAEA